MDITILPSGALRLTLDPQEREEVAERYDQVGEELVLAEFTESYWTNGGFKPFSGDSGEPFVGLTSAPCIAESMSYDEDGKASIEGRLWWFPDYAVRSPVEILIEKGEVEWPLAPGYEPSQPRARQSGMGR